MDEIRENVWDIAGIRVASSFISDTYRRLDAVRQKGSRSTRAPTTATRAAVP